MFLDGRPKFSTVFCITEQLSILLALVICHKVLRILEKCSTGWVYLTRTLWHSPAAILWLVHKTISSCSCIMATSKHIFFSREGLTNMNMISTTLTWFGSFLIQNFAPHNANFRGEHIQRGQDLMAHGLRNL